jgi:serine phosphatase RsbU (regulator of sigma subunit)
MAARVLLRALASEYREPRDILPRANAALSRARVGGAEQFLECGMLVLRDAGVEWASAGRVPAAILRRGGEVEELGSHGPPLGMMEGFRYASHPVPMAAGDVFVVLSQASMGVFRGAADLVAKIQQRPAGEVVETLHLALRRAHGEELPRETTVLFARKH